MHEVLTEVLQFVSDTLSRRSGIQRAYQGLPSPVFYAAEWAFRDMENATGFELSVDNADAAVGWAMQSFDWAVKAFSEMAEHGYGKSNRRREVYTIAVGILDEAIRLGRQETLDDLVAVNSRIEAAKQLAHTA